MAGMPKEVGPEARDAAMMLDQMLEGLLAEAGLPRIRRTGATLKSLGLLVQYAIDQRMERLGREGSDRGRMDA